MGQLTHGMNLEQVEELGRFLQGRAGELDRISAEVDAKVRASSWLGSDADTFRNDWWPAHRKHLVHVGETVRGFGQSALNNASEQRAASDEAATVAGPGGSIAAPPPVATAPGSTSESSGGGQPGAASGMLPGSNRTIAEMDASFRRIMVGTLAPYGPGGDFEYQCTAWANFRWRELGYDGPLISGHGGAMAGNAPGDLSPTASLGAMASYGAGTPGSPGHVMIVEELHGGGAAPQRIRVSEMNVGNNDWNTADASEYRSDAWWARQSDGSWRRESDGAVRSLNFAGFPA